MTSGLESESKAEHAADDANPWPDGGGPLRAAPEQSQDEQSPLILDLEGFEGPLDLLLRLAREQKVDIAKISVLALAEQYLKFINEARKLRLELAADYLVMAAWLAYLKSRLLIPDLEPEDEVPAEELAARLAFRLQRLQAMRDAAAQLMARNRLGRDVFGRGDPEPVIVDTQTEYSDNLFDLLQAYATGRQRDLAHRAYEISARPTWTVAKAREILKRLLGEFNEWGRFDTYLAEYLATPEERPGVLASSFVACLEMAKEGALEIRQERAFMPLYLRNRSSNSASAKVESMS
ncbi:MAG: segregation/condensation protein A [Alphaproteobacteria bacterium]|nr:segregation/condensation protein A [Alphaproteobacteria bacterium]